MTPSQRDEDLKAFTEWETTGSCGMSDVWLAALEYERERVKRETGTEKRQLPFHAQKWFPRSGIEKREEPTFSEVLAALRSEATRQNIEDDHWPLSETVRWLERHLKSRPEPRLQDDERNGWTKDEFDAEEYTLGMRNPLERGIAKVAHLIGRRTCACRRTKEK